MQPELFRDQNAHALIVFKRGPKYLRAVALYAPPVRVLKLERAEERGLTPLTYKGQPYPVKRAVRQFKKAGRELGITKAARAVLNDLRAVA